MSVKPMGEWDRAYSYVNHMGDTVMSNPWVCETINLWNQPHGLYKCPTHGRSYSIPDDTDVETHQTEASLEMTADSSPTEPIPDDVDVQAFQTEVSGEMMWR